MSPLTSHTWVLDSQSLVAVDGEGGVIFVTLITKLLHGGEEMADEALQDTSAGEGRREAGAGGRRQVEERGDAMVWRYGVPHLQVETKPVSSWSFFSSSSFVRASPVDCSPITTH